MDQKQKVVGRNEFLGHIGRDWFKTGLCTVLAQATPGFSRKRKEGYQSEQRAWESDLFKFISMSQLETVQLVEAVQLGQSSCLAFRP